MSLLEVIDVHDSSRNLDVPEVEKTSAFPHLSADLTALPAIPGGWELREFDIGMRALQLYCPADPDLFLEDGAVLAANERNDYTPYWAFLWPSSTKMSRLLEKAPWSAGARVLELGSGIGLTGLAACARGDQVTFSDYDRTALHVCRINAFRNRLDDPRTLLLDWREPITEQFDAIIGCEVTYDAPMHAVILSLIGQMLKPGGVCWLGDPGRYQSRFFHEAAVDRGLHVRMFDQDLVEIAEAGSKGFQIFELRHPN